MKGIRNPFTFRTQVIKLAAKKLQNTKFYAVLLVSVMLVAISILSPALSSLMKEVIIGSKGRIATPTISPMAYKSEIRGMFVHCASLNGGADWGVIADTLASFGIQAVYAEMLSCRDTRYPSDYRPWVGGQDHMANAIAACHARGIEVHASMNVLYTPKSDTPEIWAVGPDLQPAPWVCPTKQVSRTLIKNLVEELVTKYPDIDGFMFDYIRYEGPICYCPDCKAKLEEWLGEGPITNWPGDFGDGGVRQEEFMEWRMIPVTELVRDIHSWMLAIKPDLKFSLAAWTYFQDQAVYWRKWIGQDTGDWIGKDYLDVVAPMMYTESLTELQDYVESDLKYMVGGPEGKIPLIAFLDAGRKTTPQLFKQEVDLVRSLGLDGWVIWRYAGPGVTEPTTHDIRDFLSAIDLPGVFSLENIEVSTGETQATITWTTDSPATSKVEYSTEPLFIASLIENVFPYWDIDHVEGTIVEYRVNVTDHSITLTDLEPDKLYYYRVQSEDQSGVATSEVYTFKL